ncbi:MAG: protein CoxF [Hyphomicrobium sp.]|uniref:protein CoxF n=1 Tax=Hyphomicrobium sp. TaxID=82 RepID=UPI0039E22966
MTEQPKAPERLDPRAEKIRRRRSIAIALTLGFMVLAFYIATFVRLGGNVVNGIG